MSFPMIPDNPAVEPTKVSPEMGLVRKKPCKLLKDPLPSFRGRYCGDQRGKLALPWTGRSILDKALDKNRTQEFQQATPGLGVMGSADMCEFNSTVSKGVPPVQPPTRPTAEKLLKHLLRN